MVYVKKDKKCLDFCDYFYAELLNINNLLHRNPFFGAS
jgi:hypothetical protein